MDWLVHNPVSDMYGPTFLLFYATVVAITLIVCRFKVKNAAIVIGDFMPVFPSHPDPYETAFLRGGEKAVIEVAVLSLLHRGFLVRCPQEMGDDFIGPPSAPPDARALNDIERTVFRHFDSPKRTAVEWERIAAEIRPLTIALDSRLKEMGLLVPVEALRRLVKAKKSAYIVVLGLAAYKLFIALSRGYTNVGLLILMAVISLLLVHWTFRRLPRLSGRGEDYLRGLRSSLDPLKGQMDGDDAVRPQELALLAAVFGSAVLLGTAFDAYALALGPQALWQPASSPASSWDSGGFGWDSGSSGDSSSDGGGGCSGGGCGGCGGGGD